MDVKNDFQNQWKSNFTSIGHPVVARMRWPAMAAGLTAQVRICRKLRFGQTELLNASGSPVLGELPQKCSSRSRCSRAFSPCIWVDVPPSNCSCCRNYRRASSSCVPFGCSHSSARVKHRLRRRSLRRRLRITAVVRSSFEWLRRQALQLIPAAANAMHCSASWWAEHWSRASTRPR